MPYSEQFNLVQVAVPKTGTTSVVKTLYQLHERHGGELTLVSEPVDRAFVKRYRLDALSDPLPGRAKHLSAAQLQLVLGDRYVQAFSFTFVRNPWARVVSRYRYNREEKRPEPGAKRTTLGARRIFHDLDFMDWLREREQYVERKGGRQNQIDKLTDAEGRILVDFVGRLESIQEGFATVCERAGVEPVAVPHFNVTAKKASYADYYDDWSRDLVAAWYQRDIEAFGYAFGQ